MGHCTEEYHCHQGLDGYMAGFARFVLATLHCGLAHRKG